MDSVKAEKIDHVETFSRARKRFKIKELIRMAS